MRDKAVGRTPRPARVPPDPSIGAGRTFIQTRKADGGVGCGPGGPPYNKRTE
jgi:hypothetical protein